MQVKFFRASSGARIAYAVEGSGSPLILLPAWASHLEAFWELPGHRRLCRRLAASHTVVMYDRWGTGLSDRTRTDLSLDADVQVLADVVTHLRLRRVALLGPSHGAPTAAAYANQAPQTVSHLILYSAAVPGTEGGAVWQAFRQLMLADWQVGSLAFSSVLMCGARPGGDRCVREAVAPVQQRRDERGTAGHCRAPGRTPDLRSSAGTHHGGEPAWRPGGAA
jgi:pimeloyl-ACP methyl ester carboxylesterase